MKKTKLNNGTKKLQSRSSLKSNYALKSNSTIKSKRKINCKSDKQKRIDSEYRKAKKFKFEENTICTGCESSINCTPSHLIPRSRRRDLITSIKNIKPHCMDCHSLWESDGRTSLLDYEENMQAVRELDYEYYKMLRRDE